MVSKLMKRKKRRLIGKENKNKKTDSKKKCR